MTIRNCGGHSRAAVQVESQQFRKWSKDLRKPDKTLVRSKEVGVKFYLSLRNYRQF